MKRCLGALGSLAFLLALSVPAIAQGGVLVRAEWGVRGQRVDVTETVRSLAHDGILQFEATRQTLGVDPAPGQAKELTIRIRHWDGDTQEYTFPERSLVSLEVDPDRGFEWRGRSLHIMRAYYGGEGHFVNVTERLQHMVRHGQIFTRVDNEHLALDPDPHVHKVLRILYWVNGERRNIVVPEKADLRLP